MALIGVGGDGSVQWRVRAGNVKSASHTHNPKQKTVRQNGIAKTVAGQQFRLSFEASRTMRNKLVAKLSKGRGVRRVTIQIPIRPHSPNQIVITW
jgi:hypothetical protein